MHSEYDEGLFDVQAAAATTWGVAENLPPVAESWNRLLGLDDIRAAGRVAMRGLSFVGNAIMAAHSPGVHTGANPRMQSEAPTRYRGRHEAINLVARQRSEIVAAAESIVVTAEQAALVSQTPVQRQDAFVNA